MGLLGRRGRKGKAFLGALARAARRFRQWVKQAKQSSSSSPPHGVPKFGTWDLHRDREDSHSRALSMSSGMARSISSGDSTGWRWSPEPRWARPGAAGPRPAELGCVNHQQPACMPGSGRTNKMTKFDCDMLANIRMMPDAKIPSRSGTMFRATWLSDEGLKVPVAIKVFHHLFDVETKKHVSEELKGKLLLRHRNLLCPLGYAFRDEKLHLLYEYMENRSLDQHIFTKETSRQDQQQRDPLSWDRRWSIINGVATALLHLHSNGAVHGSVKSSNVLLDPDMTVRLGDFAYSRAPYAVSLSEITCLGLPPECCPETVTFPVTAEPTFAKDVFCFGSVILEVVCARKTSHGLLDWVRELYDSDNILGAVDKTLLPAAAGDSTEADEAASGILLRVLLVGIACTHSDPSERPPMEDVVDMLAGSAPVPHMLVPSEYRADAHPPLCLETDESTAAIFAEF